MRRALLTFVLALGAAPVTAQSLTYEGRDAQGLHCVAMIMIEVAVLEASGDLTPDQRQSALQDGAKILAQLPGTPEQKNRAAMQRAERILETFSGNALADEHNRTMRWCERDFLTGS